MHLDSQKLFIVPREENSQIVRCNGDIDFTFDIFSQPDNLEDLNLTWLDPHGRILRSDESTRLTLNSGYLTQKSLPLHYHDENETIENMTRKWKGKIVETRIKIAMLTKADSGNYTLIVQNSDSTELLNSFSVNTTLQLLVLPCGLADLGTNYIFAAVGTCVILLAMLIFIVALVNRIKVERVNFKFYNF